ncbi:hypothetical protein LC612_41025 [Nostoc sp. CHAB 5834]|nr:hypothetical protein [Nostoc sp. CHAB 5834]
MIQKLANRFRYLDSLIRKRATGSPKEVAERLGITFSILLFAAMVYKIFARSPAIENGYRIDHIPNNRQITSYFFPKEKTNQFEPARLQELIINHSQPVRRLKPGKVLAYTSTFLLISSMFFGIADKKSGRNVCLTGCAIAPVSVVLTIRDRNK